MEQEFKNIKYKFFWNGILSNWYKSYFVVDGIKFNCGEQYMMYQKAITFNDFDTSDKILKEPSPKFQKQLGREVKNFNAKAWDDVKFDLVKKGLYEKFNQNPDLKTFLLKYKGFQLVEASPYDKIWGIGYHENDALKNIDNWGENLLGKILTDLTIELK